ncbi:hypothetical protein BaRGS_00002505 [Batillaria attramentaria]|uniref:Uncharacterized protein n=1 Tax=Batillaria attramentaria TaxID=370345 RepID=A0ABD0M3W3_9CAEN
MVWTRSHRHACWDSVKAAATDTIAIHPAGTDETWTKHKFQEFHKWGGLCGNMSLTSHFLQQPFRGGCVWRNMPTGCFNVYALTPLRALHSPLTPLRALHSPLTRTPLRALHSPSRLESCLLKTTVILQLCSLPVSFFQHNTVHQLKLAGR